MAKLINDEIVTKKVVDSNDTECLNTFIKTRLWWFQFVFIPIMKYNMLSKNLVGIPGQAFLFAKEWGLIDDTRISHRTGNVVYLKRRYFVSKACRVLLYNIYFLYYYTNEIGDRIRFTKEEASVIQRALHYYLKEFAKKKVIKAKLYEFTGNLNADQNSGFIFYGKRSGKISWTLKVPHKKNCEGKVDNKNETKPTQKVVDDTGVSEHCEPDHLPVTTEREGVSENHCEIFEEEIKRLNAELVIANQKMMGVFDKNKDLEYANETIEALCNKLNDEKDKLERDIVELQSKIWKHSKAMAIHSEEQLAEMHKQGELLKEIKDTAFYFCKMMNGNAFVIPAKSFQQVMVEAAKHDEGGVSFILRLKCEQAHIEDINDIIN